MHRKDPEESQSWHIEVHKQRTDHAQRMQRQSTKKSNPLHRTMQEKTQRLSRVDTEKTMRKQRESKEKTQIITRTNTDNTHSNTQRMTKIKPQPCTHMYQKRHRGRPDNTNIMHRDNPDIDKITPNNYRKRTEI